MNDPLIQNFVSKALIYTNELENRSEFNRRGWFNHRIGQIYFRAASRYLKDYGIVETLDIANISINLKFQGKGVFSLLIKSLTDSTDRVIFVESVLNKRLDDYLSRTGWILECPINRNYFLKKKC